jgi:inner membrane protein
VWLPVVLASLATAPDLDVLAFRFGIPYDHPLGHRGFTHSLVFAALVAALSLLVWRRAIPAHAHLCAALTFLAVASHGVLDAFTDAGLGVGLLIPFDTGRYFAPWRPILTSPLSVAAFFSPHGMAVLANEALWVGAPTLLLVLLVTVLRRASDASRTRRWRTLR